MKTGMCTIAFRDWDLEAALDLAQKAGFDGVEIWGKEPHMSDAFDKARVERTKAMLDERGLLPIVFGSYLGDLQAGWEGELERANDALRIARELGTDLVRVWAGAEASGAMSGAQRKECVAFLRAFAKRAEEEGITLAIERHANTLSDTLPSLMRLIEEVGSGSLRVNYQMMSLRNEDILEEIRQLGSLIVNVHAHNFADYEERKRRLLSEGVIDHRRMVEALREVGFEGAIEVEFAGGEDREQAMIEDAAFLKSAVSL